MHAAPTILNVGLDTFKLNVKLKDQPQRLPVELEVYCQRWQEQAREHAKPAPTALTFHEERMTMLPNGAPAWKYIVKNECLQVCMAPRLRVPMVAKITLASRYLWEMGSLRDALDEVDGFLYDLFGSHLILQAAQVDLCVDLVGLVLPHRWEQVFISHAIGKQAVQESQKDRPYFRGRTLETITFSGHGSPVSCKIYNKTAEIRQRSHKYWFFDLWRRKTGADGLPVWNEEKDTPKEQQVPVWRVEFSLERAGLHELKLETVEDVLPNLQRMWAYCTREWLRMVIPGPSKNRTRWATHPTWILIQQAFDDYDEAQVQGLGPLVRQRQVAANLEQGIAQVAGQATTLAAWMRDLDNQDVDALDVFHAVFTEVVKRWAEHKVDVATVVQEKRLRYHQVP